MMRSANRITPNGGKLMVTLGEGYAVDPPTVLLRVLLLVQGLQDTADVTQKVFQAAINQLHLRPQSLAITLPIC